MTGEGIQAPARPITSVLVANRGEIARRVFRTAEAMGLRTVAVFVDADAEAPFVAEADQAVRIGGYLDGDAIIAAAKMASADAIHPGYGFLAENAGFASAVEAAGIAWVGPSPSVIEAMGDKIRAKELAVAAGVPVLPSSDDPAEFAEVGFPLLVKAAAGGGGKGMRVVASAAELDEAVASARREAASGFGDDRVFAERYVTRARHIEIQIFGDADGQVGHLGERECSIQRRHQKVIEESPSPFVTPELRRAMGAAAVGLAETLGYRSAGTVEFLVDDDTGEFFFLEVNTRLQVEHPVTEAVTGRDLVRDQLLVAMGEPIEIGSSEAGFAGHAIEARLYAEDPANGFLPSTGTLDVFEPAAEPHLRWDNGVESGSAIGVDFDPMIAKVIAAGPTRAEAAGRLALGLERLHLGGTGGLVTNRDFLVSVLRHPGFLAGDTTTDFIERHAPVTGAGGPPGADDHGAAAAALWLAGMNRADADVPELDPRRLPHRTAPARTGHPRWQRWSGDGPLSDRTRREVPPGRRAGRRGRHRPQRAPGCRPPVDRGGHRPGARREPGPLPGLPSGSGRVRHRALVVAAATASCPGSPCPSPSSPAARWRPRCRARCSRCGSRSVSRWRPATWSPCSRP